MGTDLVFDEVLHRYTLDGVVIPSVTQIMKPLYDFSHVNQDVLRRAGDFGTAVHKTIELYLADDLDEDSLDENLLNPFLAFKAWQADNYGIDLDGARIERFGYHKKLKYAGTPDIETDHFIIDIKSRKCNPLTDGIQLAAYDYMTGKGDRLRYVLELKQDASYVFTNVGNKQAWSRFRFLLDYHNATQTINSWRK
jgi:hypothetical protein